MSAGRTGSLAVGGVFALLIMVFAASIGGAGIKDTNRLVGKAVPEVTGVTMEGDSFDIDDYRGQWLAVNFFASWCVACQQEHPELIAWRAEHLMAGDAELITLVMGDTDKAVREFFAERGGGEWPVLGEAYESYSVTFGVIAVPETFMISPFGLVVGHLTGAVTADQLDGVIEHYSQGT